MSKGLSIQIDGESFNALVYAFSATQPQVEAAMRSTYAKMGRWLRTRAIRGLSSKIGIQQKILRARIKTFRLQGGITSGGEGAKVWFGLRPIPLSKLNPVATPTGVRVAGGRFIEGAFIASYGGKPQVLKRRGKDRFPLDVHYADIADESTVYIEDELVGTDEFDRQFFKFLEHELKWRTRILQ